jgi:hypothetical protein
MEDGGEGVLHCITMPTPLHSVAPACVITQRALPRRKGTKYGTWANLQGQNNNAACSAMPYRVRHSTAALEPCVY